MREVISRLSQWKEDEVMRPRVGDIHSKLVWDAQSNQRHFLIQVAANSEKLILNLKRFFAPVLGSILDIWVLL